MCKARLLLMFLFLFGGGYSQYAQASSPPSLFDLNCKKNERATGCMLPYAQCEVGVQTSIVETCSMSAQLNRCPDFGWEKCCAANCYLRAGKRTSKMGACMEECGRAADSGHYWPAAPSKKK